MYSRCMIKAYRSKPSMKTSSGSNKKTNLRFVNMKWLAVITSIMFAQFLYIQSYDRECIFSALSTPECDAMHCQAPTTYGVCYVWWVSISPIFAISLHMCVHVQMSSLSLVHTMHAYETIFA